MPKANPNEARGEQMDIDASRIEASLSLAKAQATDAYRQCRDSFIRINDSNKALKEAKVVILAYAESNGRNVQVTQALGIIERAITDNRKWMADNS